MEREMSEMELASREAGRKKAEKSDRRGERWEERDTERWAEQWGEREAARGEEQWGERAGDRGSRRQVASPGSREIRQWEGSSWGGLGFPEVRGTRMATWPQPSSPEFPAPGFKEKEATAGRRSRGGGLSHSLSGHPPETYPTRLSRMQQEVGTLDSSTQGAGLHREAGTEPG